VGLNTASDNSFALAPEKSVHQADRTRVHSSADSARSCHVLAVPHMADGLQLGGVNRSKKVSGRGVGWVAYQTTLQPVRTCCTAPSR